MGSNVQYGTKKIDPDERIKIKTMCSGEQGRNGFSETPS